MCACNKNVRDDFKPKIKELLGKRVQFHCSNPDCKRDTIGPNSQKAKIINIGKAAHITAAAPGGARYDLGLSPDERAGYNNGIWLCSDCADLIDKDPHRYTVDLLYEWKRAAEFEATDALERPTLSHSSDKNNAHYLINSALIAQQNQLADMLLNTKAAELESQLKAFRAGKIEEPLSWIRQVRNTNSIWSLFSPDLKAKILTLQANIEFYKGTASDTVRALIAEIHGICREADTTALEAIIEYTSNGSAAALTKLEENKCLKQNSLNLKASIYLELGRKSECANILNDIIDHPITGTSQAHIAESYRIRALLHLLETKTDLALQSINEAIKLDAHNELIKFTSALIHYYYCYTPSVLPSQLEPWPEPPLSSLIKSDDDSIRALENAESIFNALMQNHETCKRQTYNLTIWKLACLANNPNRRVEASNYCSQILNVTPECSPVILWAIARDLDFDIDKSIAKLETLDAQQTIHQILALLTCYSIKRSFEKSDALLARTKHLFVEQKADSIWYYWQAQTLVKLNKPKAALESIDQSGLSMQLADIKSLALRKLASQNNSWHALFDHLENTYAATNNAIYLYDICWQKAGLGDWNYIADRADVLVNAIRSTEALRLAALGLYHSNRFKECVRILEHNADLFPKKQLSSEMLRILAQSKAELGKISEAVKAAESVNISYPSAESKMTLAQLYLRSGDLKKLNVLAREILDEKNIASHDLLQLAEIVSLRDRQLGVALLQKAKKQGIQDEDVANAVGISFQLGIEHSSDELYKRMTALANKPGFNIWTPSLDEIIALMQSNSEQNRKLNDSYLNAQAPVHIITSQANRCNLVYLYHHLLKDNRTIKDQTAKYPLFAVYGGRPCFQDLTPKLLKDNLLVDVTSILLLEHIGVLDNIVCAYGPITISAETIQALIKMQESLLHIQPSIIAAKKLISTLLDANRIKTFASNTVAFKYSQELQKELGDHWLTIYDQAARNRGYAVDYFPILKCGTMQPAQIFPPDHYSVLTSCKALFDTLKESGPLSSRDYEMAIKSLGSVITSDDKLSNPPIGSKLFCNIHVLDSLAATNYLDILCEKFEIWISEKHAEELRNELTTVTDLSSTKEWLDNLIDKISGWLNVGTIKQLATCKENAAIRNSEQHINVKCLMSIMTQNETEDNIICIDDRWSNSFLRSNNLPIVTSFDLLEMLVNDNLISLEQHYAELNKLRDENVCYIPIETNEIVRYLKQASVKNGILSETRDLSVLRKYIAGVLYHRDNFQKPPLPDKSPNKVGEIPYVIEVNRAVINTFIKIWNDDEVSEDVCYAYSNWVYENLFQDGTPFPNNSGLISELHFVALNISGLILQAVEFKPKLRNRRRKFFSWLYSTIINPRLVTTPELLNLIIDDIKQYSLLMPEQTKLDNKLTLLLLQRFYQDLPPEIRDILGSDDEFMSALGYTRISAVGMDDLSFKMQEFFPALKRVINGEEISLTTYNSEFSLTLKPYKQKHLYGFQFTHPSTGQIKTVVEDVFGILLNAKQARHNFINKHKFWFDCEQESYEHLLNKIDTLEPNDGLELVRTRKNISYVVFYNDLNTNIQKNQGIRLDEMLPTNLDGMLSHLRINKLQAIKNQPLSVDIIGNQLANEEDLYIACERIIGLPAIFPQVLLDKIISLRNLEQKRLVRQLKNAANTPISLLHFTYILAHLSKSDDFFDNALKKQLRYFLSEDYKRDFELFHNILKWVDEEFSAMPRFVELSAQARLMIVWEHSNRIYHVLKANGINRGALEQCLLQIPKHIPCEIFNRNLLYWHDVANPRQLCYTTFLLMGISYIVQNTKLVLSDQIKKQIHNIAYPGRESSCLPNFDLVSDPTLAYNNLNSFLGADRANSLSSMLNIDSVYVMQSEQLHESANKALDELIADQRSCTSWLVLNSITSGHSLYADLNEKLKKIFENLELIELIRDNVEALFIIHFISAQVLSIADKQLLSNLEKQLAQLLRLAHQNELRIENVKHELLWAAMIELALNLSIASGKLGEISSEKKFTQLIENFFQIWMTHLPGLRDTLKRMYFELPVQFSKHFWPLLMKCRATA